VVNNKGAGIGAGSGNTIEHCTIGQNAGGGLVVANRCYVSGNTIESTTLPANHGGLVIIGNGNRINNNNFAANGYAGLLGDTGGTGNIIIRNTFRGGQYILPAGNVTGPFVDLSAGGGTIPSPASPWRTSATERERTSGQLPRSAAALPVLR
jgi:hypothetical protein